MKTTDGLIEERKLRAYACDFFLLWPGGGTTSRALVQLRPAFMAETGRYSAWTGRKLVYDTYREVVEGHAMWSPYAVNYHRIEPGETSGISLATAIPYPLIGASSGYTLRIYAYGRAEN